MSLHLGKMNVNESNPFTIDLNNMKVNVSLVRLSSYGGQTFSVRMKENDSRKDLSEMTKTTSVTLPPTIFKETNSINHNIHERTIFEMFIKTTFFQYDNSTMASGFPKLTLNSFVLCASIKDRKVDNLTSPIVFEFASLKQGKESSAVCVYWDESQSKWFRDGCRRVDSNKEGIVRCECDHLTNFAVLVVGLIIVYRIHG